MLDETCESIKLTKMEETKLVCLFVFWHREEKLNENLVAESCYVVSSYLVEPSLDKWVKNCQYWNKPYLWLGGMQRALGDFSNYALHLLARRIVAHCD